ncbi:uncharacterized protein PV09_01860 [Verruconis gallopava]|uniref:Meiotically up-regulated protein Msb1/Mug8 domain-containing protein n=1 Tax=Verruconis gallopava TaxID=253628 RepID=A0A0D2B9Q5_9PEZI|nr:uncharacterized protein PV09_01860 [Verruconis gallopava]KIW07959.1 hypothetical protein PV09_01860 [Verruconis gallopava]
MPFFSKVFKRDAAAKGKSQTADAPVAPEKPRWEESWTRKEVAAEDVQELIHACSQEMKSRALDMPFLLLPFRPGSDPVGSKSFIRNYFRLQYEGSWNDNKHFFEQELRLMDPLVLVSIIKWCWSRLPGGVVTWETYDLFKQGETDSKMSKNAFSVFVPIATESAARTKIVVDFFDLLAAIAARGKMNGLGGRKLSRMAGWWAFEHSDHGKGFDGGYHSWARAADATSHLFFAYLRSLAPDESTGVSGISQLPRSLQALLAQTEYPPETPTLMLTTAPKVVMIVNSVSPTPFALLRRARNFEFRDDDEALQQFSSYDDPVRALTDECRRVINCVSNVNESVAPTNGGVPQDGAWSRFEDMGFSSLAESLQSPGDLATSPKQTNGLRYQANSKSGDFNRPTTPSWADFLSTGFPDENGPTLLPPDKSLPLPIGDPPRGHSSQSHVRNGLQMEDLEAGELASVNQFDLDETFWWVWMTSLAGEETPERKAVFGRCALIETQIRGAHWMVIEEQIKGASPGQEEGVYLAEKKSRFSWTRRGRMSRKKTVKKSQTQAIEERADRTNAGTPSSRLAPDQHVKVREAAARLKTESLAPTDNQKRARLDDAASQKTSSVLTLQPAILSEAGPALKWTKDYDRDAIKAAYLQDPSAGKGETPLGSSSAVHLLRTNGESTPKAADRELPAVPRQEPASPIQRKPVKVQTPPATPPHQSDEALSAEPEEVAEFTEKPKLDKAEKHPALRKQESPESQRSTSPELSRDAAKKSLKPTAASSSGGFKKLFGKKKTSEAPAPAPVTEPATEPAPAPAAASTAKPSSPHKLQKSPPKSTPKSIPIEIPYQREPTPEPSVKETSPIQSINRQITHPAADHYRAPSPPAPITETEQLDADREFSRFDQGPLEDVPAFVPESTPGSSIAAISPSPEQTAFTPPPAPEEAAPLPVPAPAPVVRKPKGPIYRPANAPPVEPTAVSSPQEQTTSPATDRWAQIRKNAAERAQRMNQQQEESRRSHSQSGRTDKTDDGDTSGEETIESRVARIKARVAELTGNMDTPGMTVGGARR